MMNAFKQELKRQYDLLLEVKEKLQLEGAKLKRRKEFLDIFALGLYAAAAVCMLILVRGGF